MSSWLFAEYSFVYVRSRTVFGLLGA